MTHVYGALSILLLTGLAYGVWLVKRDTDFLAGVVQDNMDAAAQQMAELTGQDEYEDESDYGTRPIGFHSVNQRGN